MNDDQARLHGWWARLNEEQRANALESLQSGALSQDLLARLQQQGVTGKKSGSTQMTRQVRDFLKTRHDP